MNKRFFTLVLTLAMCFSLSAPPLAVGGFRDVDQNAWYLKYLDTAVDSGLINGRGAGRFAPNDDITGSEAVKLAACIGQLLTEGSVSLTNGSPWYASYMEYAVEEGILDAPLGQYALSAPITRAELMNMLCRAIPRGQRTQINSIPDGAIPDLYPSAPYRDNIYTLYRSINICLAAQKLYAGCYASESFPFFGKEQILTTHAHNHTMFVPVKIFVFYLAHFCLFKA